MAQLSISLVDAQTQLAIIQAALQDIISGKRINSLKVGSAQFTREYRYQEIDIATLRQLQTDYLTDIAWWNSQMSGSLPVFANNKTIPLLIRKDYFNPFLNNGGIL